MILQSKKKFGIQNTVKLDSNMFKNTMEKMLYLETIWDYSIQAIINY